MEEQNNEETKVETPKHVHHAKSSKNDTYSHIQIGLQICILLVGLFASAQLVQMNGFFTELQADVPSAPAPSGAAAQPSPTPTARADVSEDDDAVKGDEDAPVTIIEFSDYECPFCGRFYTQTLDQIEKEYVETGKVKMVFRDFPLSFHPNAKPAAIAAECAGDQGKYWEMHDKLFQNQGSLSESNYKAWAADIGLNAGEFANCLADPEKAAEVDADFAAGQAAGVRGTPAFFVNGKLISGAQPFEAFKAAIDAELN